MKFLSKFLLTCLAFNLVTSSAFAVGVKRPKEPTISELAISMGIIGAIGAATYKVADIALPSPLNIPGKILVAGYWLNFEYELIKEYQKEKAEWKARQEYTQALKKISDWWKDLDKKYPEKAKK